MTPQKLIEAAHQKRCVTGFHQLCTAKHYMPAAFLIGMPFSLVMAVLPRVKIYKRKSKP